ncbi:lipoyl protein ligase domain-containing protein [Consotaella aegiceratis]|uniref:lipoyl protein ligase domain-containing protein n=1 Tax=Consotaella aegiceratis TaxID=3097961 RepID=UPI002F42C6E9
MPQHQAGLPGLIEDFTTADLGLHRQEHLAEAIVSEDRPALLLWRAPRALIVGRLDTRLPRFAQATETLRQEGWPVLIRRSGGAACPVSPGTLQVALARTVRPGMTTEALYMELVDRLNDGLAAFGLRATTGIQPEAFCPGRFDMSLGGRKVGGLSQHWRQRGGRFDATTAVTLVVDEDRNELARINNLFYRTAGGSQRCRAEAMGSVAAALPQHGLTNETLMHDLGAHIARSVATRRYETATEPASQTDDPATSTLQSEIGI